VKISLAPLEATWVDLGVRSEGEDILVVDDNGVVILSSIPAWKYHTLSFMPAEQISALERLGKYPSKTIKPLEMALEKKLERGVKLVKLPIEEADIRPAIFRTLQERPMNQLGWKLVILSDPIEVWRSARFVAWGGGAITAFFCLLAMYLLQRRRAVRQLFRARSALQQLNGQLEDIVGQRTRELHQSNQELTSEIRDRKLVEEELVQAGKLAVIGQMSAGVSHEINQPLTALHALAKNTTILLEKGRMQDALDNLKSISAMTERMGRITAQLKSFARKGRLSNSPVALDQVIGNVQLLLEHRVRNEQVTVEVNASGLPLVYCDSNRLEQVLINLCTNALDAMATQSIKVLTIAAQPRNNRMVVSVADTGVAIPESVLNRLFEPFFSTKPAGEGLGLGLVISVNIIKEFGGELRVRRADVGLIFEFDLELLQEEHHV
jgi:two-component system C4-dicarboxylate transport sensor histidine kinase DctB